MQFFLKRAATSARSPRAPECAEKRGEAALTVMRRIPHAKSAGHGERGRQTTRAPLRPPPQGWCVRDVHGRRGGVLLPGRPWDRIRKCGSVGVRERLTEFLDQVQALVVGPAVQPSDDVWMLELAEQD